MTAWRIWAGALVGLAGISPARADVTAQTPVGFVSRNIVVVAGTPAVVWKRLVTPSAWWSGDHTFSGDAANLTLDPVAGGCFCEKLPADPGEPAKTAKPGLAAKAMPRGGVVHMRVVFVDRAKALRLVGALGPLQSEAVNATLTITLTPLDGGTRVIFEYVVGGYMRYPTDKIAPAVDTVLANQLIGLARAFGPAGSVPAPAAPPEADAPAGRVFGHGLDSNGLLVPRGRVWSMPSSDQPVSATPAQSEQNVAPMPTAPVPQDQAATGGAASPATQDLPDAAVAPNPSAAPPRAQKPHKSAKKSKTSNAPPKQAADSAFDAAFGGAPPAPNPSP